MLSSRSLRDRSVRGIYDGDCSHDDAHAVAEAMMEFDESFQKFRRHHIFLIHRSIGMGSASLKGELGRPSGGCEASLLPRALGRAGSRDGQQGRVP